MKKDIQFKRWAGRNQDAAVFIINGVEQTVCPPNGNYMAGDIAYFTKWAGIYSNNKK